MKRLLKWILITLPVWGGVFIVLCSGGGWGGFVLFIMSVTVVAAMCFGIKLLGE